MPYVYRPILSLKGKLPRCLRDVDLLPVLSSVGQLYEMRLMVDFSGTNRGFCFVTYATPDEAKKAVRLLNNLEIEPGRRIGAMISVDNRRLFVGGIPKEKTREEVRVSLHIAKLLALSTLLLINVL